MAELWMYELAEREDDGVGDDALPEGVASLLRTAYLRTPSEETTAAHVAAMVRALTDPGPVVDLRLITEDVTSDETAVAERRVLGALAEID